MMASHKFKRVRFLLLVVGTLVGLFYYSFLNEENSLNQLMDEEEMPRVTVEKPAAEKPLAEGGSGGSPSADDDDDAAGHANADTSGDLSNAKVLREKNKYFPLLSNEEVETKKKARVPDDYFKKQHDTKLRDFKRKPRYPVGKENFHKVPKVAKGEKYPVVQSSYFTDGGRKVPDKLARVKAAFERSWKTYKNYGYGHDEVLPLSRQALDPFNGWSATLVDGLDTLYLMGMDDEFKEAIEFLKGVNFKQTYRDDIPVFENVIRILGGLLSGYEFSQDESLLKSATDLGTLIMEAFDTPNRMPVLYYKWRDEINNRFAARDASLAEIGSMSLEFTRLSQLTGDNQYYDAITRITNTFENSADNFLIEGLFSNNLDASGCRVLTKEELDAGVHLNNPNVIKAIQDKKYVHCMRHTEIKPADDLVQAYSFGGLADSFYEYLPKMFHTLRGDEKHAKSYKDMYKKAVSSMKEYMLYRPQIPGGDSIYFISSLFLSKFDDAAQVRPRQDMQHLTCFAGGMLALGSRLFDIPQDMKIAEQVTMGCVEMYRALSIMPESMLVRKMGSEADFYDEEKRLSKLTVEKETTGKKIDGSKPPADKEVIKQMVEDLNKVMEGKPLNKRQVEDSSQSETTSGKKKTPAWEASKIVMVNELKPLPPVKVLADGSYLWQTKKAANQPIWIDEMNPKYILRPEAIESVFYMYRITGDSKWRDYGWMMWENIEKTSQTKDGEFAALKDITKKSDDNFDDSLESFWFSETLKYFYLLFDDISVMSLDEWVLNTEAHPFKLVDN